MTVSLILVKMMEPVLTWSTTFPVSVHQDNLFSGYQWMCMNLILVKMVKLALTPFLVIVYQVWLDQPVQWISMNVNLILVKMMELALTWLISFLASVYQVGLDQPVQWISMNVNPILVKMMEPVLTWSTTFPVSVHQDGLFSEYQLMWTKSLSKWWYLHWWC